MKHSILVKFLVIFLTACALVLAIASSSSIVAIESAGLYVNSLDELQDYQYDTTAENIAHSYANLYAVKQFSNLTYTMRQNHYPDPNNRGDREHWTLSLQQGSDTLIKPQNPQDYPVVKEYTVTPHYPLVSLLSPADLKKDPEATDVTSPTQEPQQDQTYSGTEIPEGYLYYDTESVWEGTQRILYYYYYYEAPEYTIRVYMHPDVLESSSIHVLTALYPLRYSAIAILAISILMFAGGMVFLCWSAGRTDKDQIHPGGLNRLPLDLYAVLVVIIGYFMFQLGTVLRNWIEYGGPHIGNLSLSAVCVLAAALLLISFVFACAAQVKVKGFYWWKNTILHRFLHFLWIGIHFCFRGFFAMLHMLPVIWQWILTAFLMASSVFLSALLLSAGPLFIWLFLLAIATCIAIVCYGAYSYGILLSGARKMSHGDLDHKIPTKHLRGNFRDFAEQLNALSEVAMLSAQRQMQSERMKTELITNVSHDIKTPLTSMINFVDLLQRPHSAEEEQQYLEVLSRQASRMKKLIEDLMDFSKASTGNIHVEATRLDAVEAVNQALGEFSDKLAAARLTPVFRQPDTPVMIYADGRLLWRIISNLLSNAVKYAMPDTRLYVDLIQTENQVLFSLKNISRQELRTSAEELLERFVQGDSSRHTEGSGLGLNIAQSLMEVQNGQLQLTLDGDLFKVILIFPRA